jgi:hypothetical protein
MKALETVNKKETAPTYNRTKSDLDSVKYRHKTEPDFMGSGYYPPERFVPLLAKFSHPANATRRAQLFAQLQRHYGNRYVQRVVSAYRAQNAEEEERKLASEIISEKGSGGPLEPGSQAVQRLKSGVIQAKLKIGQPGDIYEQEADRVADAVIRMPEPQLRQQQEEEEEDLIQTKPLVDQITPFVQKQVEEEEEELLQTKTHSSQVTEVTSNIESRIQSLKGGGQPLPKVMRDFFEPRFGYDFSGIRIQTNSHAWMLNRKLNSRAFTTGKDIFFGQGQYNPGSLSGRKLLAHELTHTIQQDEMKEKYIQRAEVDDRSCAGLTDIETDINTRVNSDIGAARTTAGTPLNVATFLADVERRLGGRGPISPIEQFIEAMPPSKRRIPPQSLSGTKYQGAEGAGHFWRLHTLRLAHVAGAAVKVNSICVGADKLGHFFQQGYQYYLLARSMGRGTAAAESLGRSQEIGTSGLGVGTWHGSTGVYSNADLAANRDGLTFYDHLRASPSSYTFNISSYISNSWNEQTNPSYYSAALARVVWRNLLNGGWRGVFNSGSSSSNTIIQVNLSATTSGLVTGTYSYTISSGTITGVIRNGHITQRTTSVTGTSATSTGAPGTSSSASPVSGITINFDWQQGSLTGKGIWNSGNEQTLNGTWGTGSSDNNGGAWNIVKV